MPEEITFEPPVTDAQPTEAAQEPQAEAPAEAPAEGEAAQEQEQQGESEDKARDEKGRFKGVQARIDELTRARHEAEREAAYWRGVAAKPEAKAPAEPAAQERPTPDKFEKYDDYVEALAEWKAEAKVAEAVQKLESKATQSKQAAEQDTRAKTWADRTAAFSKAQPDFTEVMSTADVQVAGHVMDALLESEKGPELAYHLAKNPDEAARISQLPQNRALVELGKLEASLQTKPVLKSVTKTPAPISPVGSGRATTPNLADMSMDEYRAYRAKQGAWWAR